MADVAYTVGSDLFSDVSKPTTNAH